MAGRKVMIAIDGSKPSELAFRWYVDNLKREEDKVFLVHSAEYNVWLGMPGIAADVDAITKAVKVEDDRIGYLTGNYTDECKKLAVQSVALTVKGSKAGEAIIDAARTNGADMIIMGSRGLGKVRRTILGSVSEYITNHAPPNCAVIIIRDS